MLFLLLLLLAEAGGRVLGLEEAEQRVPFTTQGGAQFLELRHARLQGCALSLRRRHLVLHILLHRLPRMEKRKRRYGASEALRGDEGRI